VVQLVKSTRDFEIFGAQPWHDSTDFGELDSTELAEVSRVELAEVRQGERSTACDKLSRVELTPKSPKIQKPQ
jgi:hypothetical protein